MSFKEFAVYAAVCDICDYQEEYEDETAVAWATREAAIQHAVDWIERDGQLLCPRCRACEKCAAKGGSSYDGQFLCDSCWYQLCATCGHQQRWHYSATSYHGKPECAGVSPDRPGAVWGGPCACTEFAERDRGEVR
jgi:hypothetical protein